MYIILTIICTVNKCFSLLQNIYYKGLARAPTKPLEAPFAPSLSGPMLNGMISVLKCFSKDHITKLVMIK